MPSATLIGNEETFKHLGLHDHQKIELEYLITRLREMFEDEYYDTDDVGSEVLAGLKSINDGTTDQRNWREVLADI